MEEFKICSKCKVPKPLDEFHKRKNGKYGRDHYCKDCGNARHRKRYATDLEHRKRVKFDSIKRNYNITHDEFINMYNSQNGKCKICNKKFERKRTTYIDHNHITGKARGLLCPKCNLLLGTCNDNVEVLQSAIFYLKANG